MKLLFRFAILLAFSCLFNACDQPEEEVVSNSKPKPRKKAGPVEHIDSKERIAAMKLLAVTDPIEHEKKVFMAEVRGAFDEKQFDKIEALAKELRESKALFRDGTWKLQSFYDGLDNRFHTGDDGYLTDLETLDAWRSSYPDSVTQRVALADMLTSYAWHARGTGYSHTVTEEGWRLMAERLDESAKALEEARLLEDKAKTVATDIHWFAVALRIGIGQSWEKEVFDGVVKEGLKREPLYWPIATIRAYSLLPRWYGEEGDWETFSEEMADMPNGLGDEVYTRVVLSLSSYYPDVIRDSDATWPRARKGMEALLSKYPDSITFQNQAAYLGTLGRDRDFAKAWFDKLGDNYIEDVWDKPERFVHFRGWAETGEW